MEPLVLSHPKKKVLRGSDLLFSSQKERTGCYLSRNLSEVKISVTLSGRAEIISPRVFFLGRH